MSNMPKGLPFFIIVWIIGIILDWTYNGLNASATWGGTGTGAMTDTTPLTLLSNLTNGNVAGQKLPLVGDISFVITGSSWFLSLFKIIFWQFNFVQAIPILAWIFAAIGMMAFWAMASYIFNAIRGNVTWG